MSAEPGPPPAQAAHAPMAFSHPGELVQFAMSFIAPRAVQVACQYDLFSRVAGGADSTAALAADTGLAASHLERLLLTCAAFGLVARAGDAWQLLPPARRFLVQGSPEYMGAVFRMAGHSYRAFAELPAALQTGRTVSPPPQRREAEVVRDFVETSWLMGRHQAQVLAETLDLGGSRRLLDVGAGSGIYAASLVRRHAGLRAVALDLPQVIALAEQLLDGVPGRERIELVAGDAFVALPEPPYDAVLLASFVHGFSPERVLELLARVRQVLSPGGRVIIQDHFLNAERSGPPLAAMFGLNILLHNDGGTTHSLPDALHWLRAAGFQDPQVHTPGPSVMPIVVATRP